MSCFLLLLLSHHLLLFFNIAPSFNSAFLTFNSARLLQPQILQQSFLFNPLFLRLLRHLQCYLLRPYPFPLFPPTFSCSSASPLPICSASLDHPFFLRLFYIFSACSSSAPSESIVPAPLPVSVPSASSSHLVLAPQPPLSTNL